MKQPLSMIYYNFLPREVHNKLLKEYYHIKKHKSARLGNTTNIIHTDTIYNQTKYIKDIFRNKTFINCLERELKMKEKLYQPPLNNPYSVFIQQSNPKKNSLGYHYDKKLYNGKEIGILYILKDENSGQKHCFKEFIRNDKNVKLQEPKCFPTPTNSLYVFEGHKILHKITKLLRNERVNVQNTFTSDLNINLKHKLGFLFTTSSGYHKLFHANYHRLPATNGSS